MPTGTLCFQYVSQADAIQNSAQLVGLVWMQFNNAETLMTTELKSLYEQNSKDDEAKMRAPVLRPSVPESD